MKYDVRFEGPCDLMMYNTGAVNTEPEGYDEVYVGPGHTKVEAFASARATLPPEIREEVVLCHPPEFEIVETDGMTYHVYCVIRVKYD